MIKLLRGAAVPFDDPMEGLRDDYCGTEKNRLNCKRYVCTSVPEFEKFWCARGCVPVALKCGTRDQNCEFWYARGRGPYALKRGKYLFPRFARVEGKKLDVVSLAPRYVCWQESKIPRLDCTGPNECTEI